jgi:hypothetical protein
MGVRILCIMPILFSTTFPDHHWNLWFLGRYVLRITLQHLPHSFKMISYLVFWGAAIVIFLAKIINFHNANTQGFWVEVSSQVETGMLPWSDKCLLLNYPNTGLFTLTSIGLIPSRVLDTYR